MIHAPEYNHKFKHSLIAYVQDDEMESLSEVWLVYSV